VLDRRHRLLTSDEFRQTLRRGRKTTIPGGVIAFLPHGDSVLRFGFVVPKTVGSAVVRNRVKRRLRAAAFVVAQSGGSGDVVVRANEGALIVSTATWEAELTRAIAAGGRR